MRETSRRSEWVLRLGKVWLVAVLASVGLGLVAGSTQAALHVIEAHEAADVWPVVLRWGVMLLGTVIAALTALLVYGVVATLLAAEAAARSSTDRLLRLESLVEALHHSNERLVNLAQMSDAAKSLLFRQREIEAMEELLHEYLIRQDYAQAEALVDDVEKHPSQAEQARIMRQEIAAARQSTSEQNIQSAVNRVRTSIEAHDWDQATRQTRRLTQILPGDPRVTALPRAINEARAQHKRQLLEAYDQAVRSGDVDPSIELLRELDRYLTPQEAGALEDSARGVFRAKLHNLGVQFAIRVTEEQWSEAVAIGEQIVNDFPNTRMAQEVGQKMERLRTLAAGQVRS